jgi:hypothetical protein
MSWKSYQESGSFLSAEACSVCGDTNIWLDNEGKSTGLCKKHWSIRKQQKTIVAAFGRTKGLTDQVFTSSDSHTKFDHYSDWVTGQKQIVKQLGLLGLMKEPRYIGRSCEICGKFVVKWAHVKLCDEHRKQYLRFMNAERQRRHRESKRNREP